MPHLRTRHLQAQLSKDLKWSKIVSLLGMRQVGKTTLLRQFEGTYFRFDDAEVRNRALMGDWAFLENNRKPVIIDESQLIPDVFSQIEFLVDKSSKPGSERTDGGLVMSKWKDPIVEEVRNVRKELVLYLKTIYIDRRW